MKNYWRISFFLVLIPFVFSACGSKKEDIQDSSGLIVAYYKNMQSNVKGYLTKGFNPLDESIVSKTDCFRFTYNKDSTLKELAFVIKGKLEDSYSYGFARRVYTHTDSSLTYVQYDKHGKLIPLSRANGASTAFAKEYMFKDGVPFGQRALDFNNQLLKGFIQKRYECDEQGRIVWEQNVNENGRAMDLSQRDGVFYRKYEFTENDLVKSTSFYEIQEKKRSLAGIHKVLYEYNEAGNIIRTSFLDENDKMRPEPGTGIAYRKMKYNELGNMLEQALYNVEDQLVIGASGYAVQKNTYDKYSNNTQSSYFDGENKPTINKEIAAFIEKLTYDDRGDLVLNEFFNTDKKLINSELLGYAYKALEYNDSGLIIREAYYDKDNKNLTFRGLGAHAKLSNYDGRGMLVKTSFENANNELFLHPACNCASIQFVHDSLGNVVEETYLDIKDQRVTDGKKGIASRKYIYDKYGFVQLTQYFDGQGNEITLNGSGAIQ